MVKCWKEADLRAPFDVDDTFSDPQDGQVETLTVVNGTTGFSWKDESESTFIVLGFGIDGTGMVLKLSVLGDSGTVEVCVAWTCVVTGVDVVQEAFKGTVICCCWLFGC